MAENSMKIFPVILSGGAGTRLWPLSREHYPKPLLPLVSDRSLLQDTATRLNELGTEVEDAVFVCNEEYRFLVAEQVREEGKVAGAIILEPEGRNTAPALTLAALHLSEVNPDSVMVVMPADHVVSDRKAFHKAIRTGYELAGDGRLVTFGIVPDRPETGYGYIKKNLGAFNNAARGTPFLVLSDLEEAECAPTQLNEWLQIPKHHNLLFRIAVREIESWLLADRSGFAYFLNIRKELIPENVDGINDPKQLVINLAKRSRKRVLRQAIVPLPNRTAKVGPDYNGQLASFVFGSWNIAEATENSESLRRTVKALNEFQPIWTNL